MNVRLIATLAFVVAVTALFMNLARAQLRAPRVPAGTAFSQEQAMATLVSIMGEEEVPHVSGSLANKAIKDRILHEFIGAGYSPEVQAAVQCSPPEFGTGCTAVENIIAVKKGTRPGKAVLATAHYDSVPAGPGIGDDLAGTAVMLQLAADIAARETKNDIIFLITDGEETGLRGAMAFADRHPLFKHVGVVVNVEARGASGPSMMFETGKGSAKLMELFARTVANPSANSLTYEIYQLMPNDTDFSVYRKKANLSGFNFAFSNSASLYHSQNDNLANLDRYTLQHHGDNAFAVVNALANADIEQLKSTSDASYFDLHGATLIIWPSFLNIPLSLLGLFGIAGLIYVHRDAYSPSAVGWSALAIVGTPALLFAVGWLLSFPLGIWPGTHPLDHPAPWAGRIALAAAGVGVSLGLAQLIAGRLDQRALLLSSWLLLATLGLALAIVVTGAAYPFMWPVLIFAVAGWAETLVRRPGSLSIAAGAGFVVIAFFWLAFLMVFELVLGFRLSHFKMLLLIPFVLTLTPFLIQAMTRRFETWIALGTAFTVVGSAAWMASLTLPYAPNHPRGLNITYYDDGAAPRWLAGFNGPDDEAYLKAAGFPPKPVTRPQGEEVFAHQDRAKPATDMKLAAPTLTLDQVLVQDKFRLARATIKGGRSGLQLALAIDGNSGIQSLRIAGQDVANTWRLNQSKPLLSRLTGFAGGVQLEIVYDPKKFPAITLIEQSPLPDSEEARALVAARTTDSAPVHGGDGAIVVRKFDLEVLAGSAAKP